MDTDKRISNKLALVFSSLSFVLLCLLTVTLGISWETNDDSMIARLLTQDAYYCIFVGQILSGVIHCLYCAFPNCFFNWWLGFSVLSVSVGVSSLIYVILRKYPKRVSLFLSSIVFVSGWVFAIQEMNFTRTSMAISTGGVALISYALRESKKGHKIALWLVGLFFMLLGREIRRDSAYIALGFLAVNGLIFLFQQDSVFQKAWLRRNISAALILLLSACFVFAGSLVNNLLTSEEEERAKALQSVRSNIWDYASLYPDYESHSVQYQEYGFSENDWALFNGGTDTDPDFFTYERFSRVGNLKMDGDIITGLKDIYFSLFASSLGALVLLLSFIILLINHPKNSLPIVLSILYISLVFSLLVRMGRINARVSDSIFWGFLATVWISSDYSLKKAEQTAFYKSLSVSCFVIWLVIAFLNIHPRQLVSPFNESNSVKLKAEQVEAFDYIDSHSENLYLLPVLDGGISLNRLHVWERIPSEYCRNLLALGGWNSRVPAAMDCWQEYGIDNPMRALLYNENIYLFYKAGQTTSANQVLAYFREHYSSSAQMRTVDTVGNYSIVEYYIE